MKIVTVFDIETGPLPAEQILPLAPEFMAPANYKDPEKIKANLEEQKAKWLADGALSAVTGQVLVAGFLKGDTYSPIYGPEPDVIQAAWDIIQSTLQGSQGLVGFCCKTFDLPFLIRRSWKLGIWVPQCIWHGRFNSVHLSDDVIDVAERWGCGSRDPRDRISLDALSKFLGIGAKNGKGAEFAGLWASDKEKALEYLKNDLQLTQAAYAKMCPAC